MTIRNWLTRKVNGLTTRGDLREAPRSPVLFGGEVAEWPAAARREGRRGAAAEPAIPHLGPYAPLIQAIRDELEHFVASYLRLHLAIAERDRYLLTSIDVHATHSEEDEELLRRFIREFRPEQIKHYLAKEVIAGLPNAGAIDLSQFAGLNAERGDGADDDDGYSELLAELRGADPDSGARPFEVNLVGRWSEGAAPRSAAAAGLGTPLAGQGVDVAIEDAEGSRRVRLPSLVPGRRYAIGKGEGCDIVVSGNYASRRHCELWFDRGAWWLTDTGSTNGVRVERAGRVLGRSDSHAGAKDEPVVVEVPAGARIVLSAFAEGRASDYPRLAVEAMPGRSTTATPIAPAPAIPMPATPSTPVFAGTARHLTIAVRMASGERRVELPAGSLPFSIGRSRNQALIVDRAHEGVSGHHLDVTAIDEAGATVEVHGDNGVAIAGVSYPAGARVTWRPGETMTLGRGMAREPECRLTLSRAEGPWTS
jgi:pSer/pThr/pTyr-binding forkhead associated (FHA) protein